MGKGQKSIALSYYILLTMQLFLVKLVRFLWLLKWFWQEETQYYNAY